MFDKKSCEREISVPYASMAVSSIHEGKRAFSHIKVIKEYFPTFLRAPRSVRVFNICKVYRYEFA